MRLEKEYPGLERGSVSHPMGARSLILEKLERLAADVMPAFTGRAALTFARVRLR